MIEKKKNETKRFLMLQDTRVICPQRTNTRYLLLIRTRYHTNNSFAALLIAAAVTPPHFFQPWHEHPLYAEHRSPVLGANYLEFEWIAPKTGGQS